jgi:hypothetical protein
LEYEYSNPNEEIELQNEKEKEIKAEYEDICGFMFRVLDLTTSW